MIYTTLLPDGLAYFDADVTIQQAGDQGHDEVNRVAEGLEGVSFVRDTLKDVSLRDAELVFDGF